MSNDRMMLGRVGMPTSAASATTSRDVHARNETPVATSTPVNAEPSSVEASRQKVEAIAQRLEAYVRSVSRSLEFRVDAASGRTVISVRDTETGDLIRQIPGEEVLRLAEMAEDQTVVLLNESA